MRELTAAPDLDGWAMVERLLKDSLAAFRGRRAGPGRIRPRGLSVSTSTVKTHLRNLYAKLGVHSRAEAVESARALGLLAPSARSR